MLPLPPMTVTPAPWPAPGAASVAARSDAADGGGTTSLRLTTEREAGPNKYPTDSPTIWARAPRGYRQRDRDLGQSFVAERDGTLAAVFLRVGPSDRAVLAGAPAARVVLQILGVSGSPRLDDRGTPGFLGSFDRAKAPELDDRLAGERFRVLAEAEGALPAILKRGQDLRFVLANGPTLRKGGSYAFLLGFAQRGRERSLALANAYYGAYAPDPANRFVGHGLRREGTPALPDRLDRRLAIAPGTEGFPDTDVWRDLAFAVEVR